MTRRVEVLSPFDLGVKPPWDIGLVILEIAMEHHQIFIDGLLMLSSINVPFVHRVPEGRSSDIMIFISKSNMEKNANPQCFFSDKTGNWLQITHDNGRNGL